MMFWRTNRALRAEVRALRLAVSAAHKKQNRLAARVKVLDARCVKHHAQQTHDQTYIDHLEALLSGVQIADVRQEVRLEAHREERS